MSSETPERDPLEQAAESFLARLRAGERPTLSEFEAQHPELAGDIRELFPALMMMEQGRRCVDQVAGPDPSRLTADQVPRQLGEYRLLREIGRGGMGVVYEAWQESLGRHVALKVLPFNSLVRPEHRERFRREARAAARLHHTNIVPVHGVGEHQGIHYYAMQFIQGQGLDAVLEEVRRLRGLGPQGGTASILASTVAQGMVQGWVAHLASPEDARFLPPNLLGDTLPRPGPEVGSASGSSPSSDLHAGGDSKYFASVARIGAEAAEALEFAHRQGVVHRDIKPSNLLLDTSGRVWIADFGLAKVEETDDLTQPGDIVGTVRYMSPERFHGQADERGDVYGLGVTLYELLTLRPAFEQGHRETLVEQITRVEPPRPRKLQPHVPRDLETIVLRAMAKEPGSRYARAGEMAEDLRRYLADRPIRARRTPWGERGWRWCRRNPVVAGLLAVVAALLLIIAGGVGWVARDQSARESDQEARRTALAAEVSRALEEARDRPADNLVKCTAAARRARSLLANGDVSKELHDRVRQTLADLQFLADWEAARLIRATVRNGAFDFSAPEPLLAAAFGQYGLPVLDLEPEEAARRIGNSVIASELISALDDWANATGRSRDRARLVAVVRLADHDPVRQRIRLAVSRSDGPALLRVARDPAVLGQPSATLELLGRSLSHGGQQQAAIDLFRRAQLHHPGDFWINHELAFCLAHAKPPAVEEALGYYRAALALRPESPGVYVNLGLALCLLHRYRDAETTYRQAIALQPTYASAHGGLGYTLLQQHRYPDAEAAYREALRLRPGDARAHVNLGGVLYNLHRFPEAERELRRAIEVRSDCFEAHANLGYLLNEQRRYTEAETAYGEALRLRPEDPKVQNGLGMAWCEQGHHRAAEALFRRAIQGQPRSPEFHFNLGNALSGQKRHAEAETEYREAVRLQPAFPEAHLNLGNLLFGQKKYAEAVTAYRGAVRLKNDLPDAHCDLGRALTRLGQWPQAIAAYDEAIRQQPDFLRARALRVYASCILGQWDRAEADIARTIVLASLPPDHIWFQVGCLRWLRGDRDGYRLLCGQLRERIAQTEAGFAGPGAFLMARISLIDPERGPTTARAVEWAEKAAAADPHCPWYLHILALAHYRAGRFDQAVRFCRESQQADPRWGGMLNELLLAMALERLGRHGEARKSFARVEQWRAAAVNGTYRGPAAVPPDLHLSDWLELEVLQHEAQRLFQPASPWQSVLRALLRR